ncbi:glutamine synthetase bacteria [Nannizzia gypsea CBS 118893]|uniref:Glutamine synthetase bacteria n=1 Tax=Arthroderma gypseum (strain ATCC MYA-4604 / CBS 118893) TaxID=535722 RepID=E4V1V9_ARTGP|nr:glutamine synthetase bacteria [Nannizzia gypsea CBS 118893]EFR04024.1 glutamine synthetase bacteria [Nannizzia gypsea CBS 118893]
MATNLDQGSPNHLDTFLMTNRDIKYVHYVIVTLFGTLETQILPIAGCQERVRSANDTHRVSPFSLWGGFGNLKSFTDNFGYGSDLWHADWTSLRAMDQHNASVLCNVSEAAAHHRDVDPSNPFHRCPRSGLQLALQKAKEQLNVSFLVGFELEFYLLEKTPDVGQGWKAPTAVPACYWSSPIFLRGDLGICLAACVDAIEAAGIRVEHFHGNFSPQHCEIALSPLPALASTDAVVQAIEIVRRTAGRNGFHATFHPKPFAAFSSCGLHAHISMEPPVAKDISDHFLSGIMRRLEILCGIGMPFEAASRLGAEMCGEWQAWGTDNKDVPVRKIRDGYFELRCIDYMSNIYLVIASYIAAGLLGVTAKEPLEQKDCLGSPSWLTDKERQALGIVKRLPSTSTASLIRLEEDRMGLDDVIGTKLMDFFLMVRMTDTKADWKELQLVLY